MATTLIGAPSEPESTPPVRRFPARYVWGALVVAAVVGAGAASASWWFLGGARLHAYGTSGGGFAVVGETLDIGIQLETSHGAVTLVSAKPVSAPTGVTIRFVATGPVGEIRGDIAAQGISVRPLRNTRVAGNRSQPFATIVVTVPRAGVYVLHDADITYRSGPRTRTVRARFDQCILAVDAKDEPAMLAEVNRASEQGAQTSTNPLVRQYVNGCRDDVAP